MLNNLQKIVENGEVSQWQFQNYLKKNTPGCFKEILFSNRERSCISHFLPLFFLLACQMIPYRRRKRRRDDDDDGDEGISFADSTEDQQEQSSLQSSWMQIIVIVLAIFLNSQYVWATGVPPPIIPAVRLDLNDLGGLQAEHLFRFSNEEIQTLVVELRFPLIMHTSARDRFWALEGLCVVLRRLVYPVRYLDMVRRFGRSRASLSRIHRHTMSWIHNRWRHLAEFDPNRVCINVNVCVSYLILVLTIRTCNSSDRTCSSAMGGCRAQSGTSCLSKCGIVSGWDCTANLYSMSQ